MRSRRASFAISLEQPLLRYVCGLMRTPKNLTRTPIVVLEDQRPNDSVSLGRFRSVGIQARRMAPLLRAWVLLLGAQVGFAGCALSGSAPDVCMHRFVAGYGRAPFFDETAAFRDELDLRVSQYLGRHPDVSSSPRVSQFAFARRVAVGMSQEEVALLVGPPVETTQEGARMQDAAKQFWPAIGWWI